MIAADLKPASPGCANWWRPPARSCRLPAPAFPPNAASRIFVRPAGFGPRCGRSRSTNFSPARRCAMRPGGAGSPWRNISAVPSRAAGISRWQVLYRAGKVPGVITQNIDNLHQASGIAAEHVVELHGNSTYASCLTVQRGMKCPGSSSNLPRRGAARPIVPTAADTSRPRPCHSDRPCPRRAMRRAEELTLGCDLFLAVGSSLVVWPAAGFPLMAKRNGARLVIINREADRLRRNCRSRGTRGHRDRARTPYCPLIFEILPASVVCGQLLEKDVHRHPLSLIRCIFA